MSDELTDASMALAAARLQSDVYRPLREADVRRSVARRQTGQEEALVLLVLRDKTREEPARAREQIESGNRAYAALQDSYRALQDLYRAGERDS